MLTTFCHCLCLLIWFFIILFNPLSYDYRTVFTNNLFPGFYMLTCNFIDNNEFTLTLLHFLNICLFDTCFHKTVSGVTCWGENDKIFINL